MMISRRRHKIIALLLVFISSIVGLALVESGMHLSGLDYALVWQPDPQLGWRHVPGAQRLWTEEGRGLVKINQLGFRDRERTFDKSTNVFRIAVFGDSMTEAVQVNLDQTFTYLIEEKLKEKHYSVEVLNFGVSGYSPVQELLLFRREGVRYGSDIVIWAVFLDNDISGCHPGLTVSEWGSPFLVETKDFQVDFSRAEQSVKEFQQQPFSWIRAHSSIYRFLSMWRWRLMAQLNALPVISQAQVPKRFQHYEKRSSPLPEWEAAWSCFERTVKQFSEEVHQQGARLLIVSVPSAYEVNAKSWADNLAAIPQMSQHEWDLLLPHQRLKAIAVKHDIAVIEPHDTFKQLQDGPPIYFGNAGHLTPHGHMKLAEIVEKFILNNFLSLDKIAPN